jgi:hypothetical protein
MRLRTLFKTLLISVLIGAGAAPVWAYRPLNGVYENTADAPVVTRSVSTSMADKDGKLNSNWDTTVVLEQKGSREVVKVDVAFSLLGNQNRAIAVRRIVLQKDRAWKQGESWEYRLQQDHLGWPGEATLVQVVSVTFANGETWDSPSKPEQKLQDFTKPDSKDKAALPTPPDTPSRYIPPIILPGGSGTGGSSSGSGYVPPRPRVSPARPGFSRSAPPQTNPIPPTPQVAQPSPVPGATTPSTPGLGSPSIGTSPNTSPPPQSTPGIPPSGTTPSSVPIPSTPSAPNPRGGTPTSEELMR